MNEILATGVMVGDETCAGCREKGTSALLGLVTRERNHVDVHLATREDVRHLAHRLNDMILRWEDGCTDGEVEE